MSRRPSVIALLLLTATAAPLAAQRGRTSIEPAELRRRLETIAHDSMGGRPTDSRGNYLTAEYLAAEFRRLGLEPGGDAGTFFQAIPFMRVAPDTAARVRAGSTDLYVGRDIVPVSRATWRADGVTAVFGGVAGDSSTWQNVGDVRGKLVILSAPDSMDLRAAAAALSASRRGFAGAAGFALAVLDRAGAGDREALMRGRATTDSALPNAALPVLLVSPSAVRALLGTSEARPTAGTTGPALAGGVTYARYPLRYAARNVIGIVRGSDPRLRHTYVSISAHNDHVGTTAAAVDHDSLRVFNRVVRPAGADSRLRPATADEAARIRQMLDSLRARRPARADTVFNGADDDGSGTVALVEMARSLMAGPRPRRSIVLISHAAEEVGLVGSRWFTDHPTLPLDSFAGEVDVDMIGRGGANDAPGGGPGYIEMVGTKRLSTEFGTLLETVNARQAQPFTFNYEYDAPGHPAQYYCRADHYSYARYGIPSASVSTGLHLDYHQLTDEPAYIDYEKLARVATLVRDFALAVANLDHRPVLNGPRTDPRTPCRQ